MIKSPGQIKPTGRHINGLVKPHGTAASEHLGPVPRPPVEGVNNLSGPVDNCVNNFCGEQHVSRPRAQRSRRLQMPVQLKIGRRLGST